VTAPCGVQFQQAFLGETTMKKMLRVAAILAIGLYMMLGHLLPAGAQAWPPKTVRIIVPFPPGGTTDVIARRVQPLLERNLKTTVVIENRGGASGSIGAQAAAVSPPDGSTFLLVFDTHGANPALLPNLPYDTVKDFAPIMLIGTSPMVITAHPTTAYKSFADVIAAAKAGTVSYGTIGAGSLAHLTMSQIGNALNVKMTHVPYKGGGPLTNDAVAGHVPIAIASVALFSPHVKGGKLRPLAVTSAKRVAQFADTPTVGESGVPGYDAESWWGLLAPGKTSPEIVNRMNAAMAEALNDPAVKQGLSEQGVDYRLSSPDDFGRFVESEIKRWTKVVKDNSIVVSQ
jgi:tripartite-type tricarboxylate transporter receptor subunit TctC